MATLGFEINSSQVTPAAAELNKLKEAATGAGVAADTLKAKTAPASVEIQKVKQATVAASEGLDALKTKATASAEAVKLVDKASRASSAAMQEMAPAVGKNAAAMAVLKDAASLNNIQMMEGAHLIRVFGENAMMGVSPLRTLGMEFGRISTFFTYNQGGAAGTFSAMGSAIKTAGSAIYGFLGPAGLAAAGLTALATGGYAIYEAFQPAVPTTKDLTTQIKSLDGSISALQGASKNAQKPIADLSKAFGDGARQARKMYDQMVAINQASARNAMDKTATTAIAKYAPMEREIRQYQHLMAMANGADPKATASQRLGFRQAAIVTANDIRSRYGLATAAVSDLQAHLKALGSAKASGDLSTEALAFKAIAKDLSAAAATLTGKTINSLTGKETATGKMADDLMAQAKAMGRAALDAQKLAGNLGKSAAHTRVIAGTDMSSGLKSAAAYAEKMGVDMLTALSAMDAIAHNKNRYASGDGRGSPKQGWAEVTARREQSASAANPTDTGTGYASAASYLATHSVKITKKLTAAQRAEQQILHSLGMGTKGYAAQLAAVNHLLMGVTISGKHYQITQAQANAEIQKLTLQAQNADPAVKALKNTMSTGWNTFFGDIRKGTSVFGALKDAALNALSSIFQKMGSSSIDRIFASSGPSGGWLSSLSHAIGLNANGGVYGPGGQIHAFAKGGIVGKPTLFPFANGTGLMGEAGPEAIMPLRRGTDGRLGVSMHSGAQSGAQGQASGGAVHVMIQVDGSGNLTPVIANIAGNVSAQAIKTYDTHALPGSVNRVLRDPTRRG